MRNIADELDSYFQNLEVFTHILDLSENQLSEYIKNSKHLFHGIHNLMQLGDRLDDDLENHMAKDFEYGIE